jgi:hypothetical protein
MTNVRARIQTIALRTTHHVQARSAFPGSVRTPPLAGRPVSCTQSTAIASHGFAATRQPVVQALAPSVCPTPKQRYTLYALSRAGNVPKTSRTAKRPWYRRIPAQASASTGSAFPPWDVSGTFWDVLGRLAHLQGNRRSHVARSSTAGSTLVPSTRNASATRRASSARGA